VTVSPALDSRFRDAAATSGALDVGYDVVESPIGPLLVAASNGRVCRISFSADPDEHLDALARAFGPRVLRAQGVVDDARRQLDEYFRGRRQGFELDVDTRTVPPFARRVLTELARIPFGETTTYGALAAKVDAPRAARAVGTVMNRNPIPIVLPCHRVVGANGSLTGYGGGLHVKERLLRLEGVLL
jgi:methylated-DNA-[protein]-cysteine S-methyltransferase